MAKSHRHSRTSWIILGGHAEWCFVCGAWRPLRMLTANSSESAGPWRKPSGDPAVNPWVESAQEKFEKKRAARDMKADMYGENGNG